MKKNIFKMFCIISLVPVLLLALMAAGCTGGQSSVGGDDAEETVVELSLAHFWPAGNAVETVVAQGWAKALDEASNGRIKIITYPGETLIPAAEIYEGVVQGVADIGMSVYGYSRGRFPVVETFLLPGINMKSSEVQARATMEVLAKLDPEELQDTKHIWTFGSGSMDLFTNTPVRTMEDLQGMIILSPGGQNTEVVEAFGGSPVAMPMADFYEALQKGVAQAAIGAPCTTVTFRLGEVTADYITHTPFFCQQLFFCVMNPDKWNSMPSDLQEIFTNTTSEFFNSTVPHVFDEENVSGLQKLNESKDYEYIYLSDEEAWLDKIEYLQEDHVKALDAKGLPGKEILQTVKETVEKFNRELPDVKYEW